MTKKTVGNFAKLSIIFAIIDFDISQIPPESLDARKIDAVLTSVCGVLCLVPVIVQRGSPSLRPIYVYTKKYFRQIGERTIAARGLQ